MSPKKCATRRLGLLAGSSLFAAGVLSAGLLVSTSASAQTATCATGSGPAAGNNGSTPVTLSAGTYNPGITCAYTGTTAAVNTTGAITVSSTAGGNGINLSATGAGVVNWNSTGGAVTGGAQTNGAVIGATSATGAINITHTNVIATGATTTHAIFAESTGGGDITIVRGGTTVGVINATGATGVAAVEAITAGGDISVSTFGTYGGRTYGIRAATSGAGSVTLDLSGTVQANVTGVTAQAAIAATAGSGGIDITINSGNIRSDTSYAILAASTGGGAVIDNIGGTVGFVTGGTGAVSGGRVDFSGVTGGVTFNNGSLLGAGRWLATGASVFSAGNDTLGIAGEGISELVSGASIDFGGGADAMNLSGYLIAGAGTIDFGTGSDNFNLSGDLAMEGLSIQNLEALNNSGAILLGASRTPESLGGPLLVDWVGSDLVANDVLASPGTTFTGAGDSRIVLDVELGSGAQAGCATIVAADCLYLPNGSTAGSTLLTVNYVGGLSTPSGFDPVGVTIVDVGGSGTSSASHFTLDPDSPGYVDDPVVGGAIERPGLFRYALRYDPVNKRHVLAGLPRSEALEYAILSGAAQTIWHMTAQTVTGRQSDLRDGAEGGSLWLRTAGEYTQREVTTTLASFSDTIAIDNSYKLYAGTIVGGADLISGSSGEFDYVLGAQIGYASSSFDLNESDSSGRFFGATGGAYASLWSDWFFLDGAVNLNGLTLNYDSPGLGSKTTTFVNSIGVAAEAGVRTRITENSFAEPLAAVSWVRTSFEEISLSGGEAAPDDAQSTRAGLGMRLGTTLSGESVSASYFVTGRGWYEFDGESGGVLHNPGADLPFADEFTGAFGEAELGMNVFNASNTLSAFATTGVKWKDGYSAVNLALGVRMAW